MNRALIETLEDRALFATVPAGFVDQQVVAGLNNPTSMVMAPDGRIFVTEQGGDLRIVKNGRLLPTPFLRLAVDSAGERGLLGVELDPDFEHNGFVYVYHTIPEAPEHNQVSRFTADGDVAAPGSGVDLFDLDDLSAATNHNGGGLHFGADGKLYISVGENANLPNAQSLSTDLGKLLRIDPDGSIPTDNPFFDQTTGNNRAIWALGLRNPFTFAVQPGTGRIFIDDVGSSGNASTEEINDGMAGANYGWPIVEGPTTDPRFVSPINSYPSGGNTPEAAITGGTFYNPATAQFPASFTGSYFFSDLGAGWIHRLTPGTNYRGPIQDFATGISQPVDLDVGADGALYYLSRGDGAIGRISATTAAAGPVVKLKSPAAGALFHGGQKIKFAATATDAAGAKLKSGAFTWRVDVHDNDRVDTVVAPRRGITAGAFKVPRVPARETDAFYRITLTVTDSAGLSTTVTRDIRPKVVRITVTTLPASGFVLVNKQGQVGPFSFDAVAGTQITLEAPKDEVINGTSERFSKWSGGRKRAFVLTVADQAKTYTATYKAKRM